MLSSALGVSCAQTLPTSHGLAVITDSTECNTKNACLCAAMVIECEVALCDVKLGV